jgi:hypothetical protein
MESKPKLGRFFLPVKENLEKWRESQKLSEFEMLIKKFDAEILFFQILVSQLGLMFSYWSFVHLVIKRTNENSFS